MNETMTHRGPDDDGIFVDAERGVALGFRRLAIVDLSSAGHQPMCNEDESVWLVFNGEIYNHLALRAELEARGHRYRSRTDSESIIHLWEEEGPECVERLEGMFGLAIWDARTRELFLARDRLGVKPLVYASLPGGFVFASEIKAVLAHPAVGRSLDTQAFYRYLTFAATPPPDTLFAGIRKLGAGERMTVSADGTLTRERYWSPFDAALAEELARTTQSERAERLRELLRDSVRARTMSDVPYGVFLSGGLDSSTNVALLSEVSPDPVRTYSIGYRDHARFDELAPARRVAEHFGTDHHEIVIGEPEFDDFLPELAYFQDEPLSDWVCIPLYYLARLARSDGTIVVQIGEGADELFHGYQTYISHARFQRQVWDRAQAVPRPIRGLLGPAADAIGRYERIDLYSQLAADTGRGRLPFWGGAVAFRGKQFERITGGRRDESSYSVVERLWAESAREGGGELLQRMTYLELRQRLAELLLMRVDKMTMAASVEGREPFLDRRIVEFALALPPDDKVAGGEGKILLRQAVSSLVPASVLARPKQGFSAPVTEWFRGEFGRRAQATTLRSGLVRGGLIDAGRLNSLWDRHRRGGEYAFPLWNLFNASLWYDRWIDSS